MRKPDFTNLSKVLERKRPDRPTLFEFFLNETLYAKLAGLASPADMAAWGSEPRCGQVAKAYARNMKEEFIRESRRSYRPHGRLQCLDECQAIRGCGALIRC